ncbi:hypothetical protein SNOG_08618 [Parastagonospora nodorum SN15]|uniref:CUE domain-containing protein n=1 Tax=Phaeosphaeria nodorum (strain SN15 / ATCC MYA-4574 / FGSC 10173) TaxID=321614 RepID=Q0UHZ6_PHANO|nr:hypothetical protein SNOG_08618 [Parastagonospora nodorum SN15]EAT83786.2 hypothetical protein SNOG_08618 [Parastagonospora nodorum SN15]
MSEKPTTDKVDYPAAQSPTTARELDFDDDNDAPTSATHETVTSPPAPAKSPKPGVRFTDDTTDIPPPKPPRPMSPQQQAQNTLIEAFPDIDSNVIKAVLVASGGKVEPAFNALLSMSDPNFKAEEAPPPQPPRPQRTQLEQDEIYARQLAEHYQNQGGHSSQGQRRQQQPSQRPDEADREHSFFDDDLPEIRKNIEQGFKETQKTVTSWISNFTKKLDGDGEPDEYDRYGNPVHRDQQRPGQSGSQRQNFGPSQSEQLYGIRKSAEQRRSADHNRYDADNRVLGDDFAQLEMRDNDDALYRNPSPNNQQNSQGKSGGKKWQPLTSVAPHPEPEDHDPFSLGDSDDEDNKTKDTNPADSERLKKAAASKEGASTGELKPAERSGSIGQTDATAAALLKEAK